MTKTIKTQKVIDNLVKEAYLHFATIYQNSKRLNETPILISSIMSFGIISHIEKLALEYCVFNEYLEQRNLLLGKDYTDFTEAREAVSKYYSENLMR